MAEITWQAALPLNFSDGHPGREPDAPRTEIKRPSGPLAGDPSFQGTTPRKRAT
jgi:hypothetical protein